MPWMRAAAITGAAAVIAAAQVKLGVTAPLLELRDPPGRSLEDFRGRKVLVLAAGADPAGLAGAAEQLRECGVELVRAELPGGGNGFWLVDEEGVVRAAETAPEAAARLVDFVKEWELGRKAFEWGCVTCHGKNGRETYYYGVKPLGGVGNRMSREQLLRALNATMIAPGRYSIRCFHFTEAELKALVTYVAGL